MWRLQQQPILQTIKLREVQITIIRIVFDPLPDFYKILLQSIHLILIIQSSLSMPRGYSAQHHQKTVNYSIANPSNNKQDMLRMFIKQEKNNKNQKQTMTNKKNTNHTQNNSKKGDEKNSNDAQIYQEQEVSSQYFPKNKDKQEIKRQTQLQKQKNNHDKIATKGNKKPSIGLAKNFNQQKQQISPLKPNMQRNSQQQSQPHNQSCILVSSSINAQESYQSFQQLLLNKIESVQMKLTKKQKEQEAKKYNQKSQYQKLYNLVENISRKIDNFQQRIFRKNESQFLPKIKKYIEQTTKSSYDKIETQLEAYQQIQMKTTKQFEKLITTLKNETKVHQRQATLQRQNAQLKAQINSREATQQRSIKNMVIESQKIQKQKHQRQTKQREIREDYEGKIRQINQRSLKEINQLKLLLQKQKKERQLQKQRRQVQKIKILNEQLDYISSNLLNFSSLPQAKSFIKNQIQQFQSKTVDIIELVFQKDYRNSNFGAYFDNQLFPFLLLIQTQKNSIWGAYSRGFQTYKNRQRLQRLEEKQKMKAFLFNIYRKQTFINDRKTDISPVQYMDSMLRFGNSEIIIKNNNLESVKVNAGNIIGQSYYNIKNRKYLTGQEQDQIKIKRLQIHRVYFKRH